MFPTEIVALIPRLRAYAKVLTRSGAEADDLVQDALMRAWRYRSSFEPGSNLKAWTFKILRNEFSTRLRGDRGVVEDVDGWFAAQRVSQPEQEWKVRHGELLHSLDQLSPETRDALLLVCGSGLTYQEAAEALGCAIGTVKSRISRARARLAEILDWSPADHRDERRATSRAAAHLHSTQPHQA
jgi:RNA polymerase sigma-70 factor (ECF subfamily)